MLALQLLVERRRESSRGAFNAALRSGLDEVAKRERAPGLVVHLVDELAASIDAGELARQPSFDALIGAGGACPAAERAVLEVAREVGSCAAYRVEERVLRAHPRTPGQGERTPGVVMVSAVYRATALDGQAFDEHWNRRHAPLALRHHVGMWDYRQLVVREVEGEASRHWDGIALMGFPSVAAFENGLFDSPEGMQIIMADTKRFLALDRSESALMGEYRIGSGAGSGFGSGSG